MSASRSLAWVLVGALSLGAGIYIGRELSGASGEGDQAPAADGKAKKEGEREILYWVAPMDPNYRSDKPGKSPMGMDLVPVYADEAGAGDVVKIDPAVVQNLGVRTAKVERGRLWRLIRTVGYVGFDEDRISHVHLRTNGWIEKLYVKSDGEKVEKGQVLFEVYSPELVNAQQEYLQALRTGGAEMRTASYERLLALGMFPEQIREIRRTRKVAQRVRYHALQDGFVANLRIREGMYVTPKMEVMTLADLSSVWLLVDVFERQADWLRVGMPAEMDLPYLPGRVWEGEVEFVYPTLDPKTRTMQVRVRFPNPDEKLRPDMYANVRLYGGPKDGVLMIPREALIRTGDMERVIIALGDGKFTAREVRAGMESGDWVEILAGLEEGETVVTSGQFLIDSEASIKGSIQRLEGGDEGHAGQEAGPVSGKGTVKAVDPERHVVTLAHEPIEALGWPAMTMDFHVADDVDLSGLESGEEIHFTLEKQGDGWVITQMHRMGKPQPVAGRGAVKAVDPERHVVTLAHDPIEALGWPAMTMDFHVADDVDLSGLKPGEEIHFTLEKQDDGGWVITGIHRMEKAEEGTS